MGLFATTVFLSAFLLFQIQPVVAKMILPWFGGSSSVWSTCIVFFQAELLLGYAYVHWLNEKVAVRKQPLHTCAGPGGLQRAFGGMNKQRAARTGVIARAPGSIRP